jgi:toxin FitB
MIVLDTNVVSELGRIRESQAVADWAQRQNEQELYICVPVVAEIAFGGYRIWLRDRSRRHLDALDTLIAGRFRDRILPFDIAVALRHGKVRARAAKREVAPSVLSTP